MLDWQTIEEARKTLWSDNLYLAYQPGYALTIVDWKSGSGFKDIKTREIVYPTMIALINLPKIKVEVSL